MAKKQTRRSISVSRVTYERLKAFCETNNISMSQLVETRVNDFLGHDVADADRTSEQPVARTFERPAERTSPVASPMAPTASAFRPMTAPTAPRAPIAQPVSPAPMARPVDARPMHAPVAAVTQPPAPIAQPAAPVASTPSPAASPAVPMTSAAARFAVEPPPPIIKPRQDTGAPKPAEKRPDQIFTF